MLGVPISYGNLLPLRLCRFRHLFRHASTSLCDKIELHRGEEIDSGIILLHHRLPVGDIVHRDGTFRDRETIFPRYNLEQTREPVPWSTSTAGREFPGCSLWFDGQRIGEVVDQSTAERDRSLYPSSLFNSDDARGRNQDGTTRVRITHIRWRFGSAGIASLSPTVHDDTGRGSLHGLNFVVPRRRRSQP